MENGETRVGGFPRLLGEEAGEGKGHPVNPVRWDTRGVQTPGGRLPLPLSRDRLLSTRFSSLSESSHCEYAPLRFFYLVCSVLCALCALCVSCVSCVLYLVCRCQAAQQYLLGIPLGHRGPSLLVSQATSSSTRRSSSSSSSTSSTSSSNSTSSNKSFNNFSSNNNRLAHTKQQHHHQRFTRLVSTHLVVVVVDSTTSNNSKIRSLQPSRSRHRQQEDPP